MERIYLDYNATTPLDPRVAAVMRDWLTDSVCQGNPSSIHTEGRRARAVIDEARQLCATILQAKEHEIIFCGSGTEANNLGVIGTALAAANAGRARHVIISAIEHHAVLHAAERLRDLYGFELSIIPCDRFGRTDVEILRKILTPRTALCAVMSANNETGVRQPLDLIGELCARHGVLLHVDAVQSAGKDPLLIDKWHATSLAIASHKFYGPKGSGLLWVRSGIPLVPLLVGGAQENQRRAGTESPALVIGLAKALELSEHVRESESRRLFPLVEDIWSGLQATTPGLIRNGDPCDRIANTLHISVQGVQGEDLLIAADLEGLALSTGSACMVGTVRVSHVLEAMGADLNAAPLRISLGRNFVENQVPQVVERLSNVIQKLRRP